MDTTEMKTAVKRKFNEMGTSPGREGSWTKAIEEQTEKIPSGAFLAAGMGAMAISLTLKSLGFSKSANFVGLWTPTILIMGLYNKFVKVEGSERHLH